MTDFVSVANYRARVATVPGGLELSIPSRRNYFIAAFLAAWLGGWFMGETSAIHQLLHPEALRRNDSSAFIAFWLCAWTLGGCAVVISLLWNLGGRERVVIRSNALSIRREIFGVGFARNYELRSVKNLRVVETIDSGSVFFGSNRRGNNGGPLAFDYGAKTLRFGAGVDVAEAKYLVSKIVAAKPALTNQ